jgi:phage shock protein E
VKGAINIPLHTIPARIDEFKNMKLPIVCFCRSGNRSNQAMKFLKNQGVETFNGGGLEDILNFLQD